MTQATSVVQRVQRDVHELAPSATGSASVQGAADRIKPPGWNGWQPADTRYREPEPTGRAVLADRLQRVLAAGRREPAARPEQRADEPPVYPDDQQQDRATPCRQRPVRLTVPADQSSSVITERPNLPPQQLLDHRVQICGEIRLACVSRPRVSAHHKKATLRQRLKVPAHQRAEAAA